MGETARHGDLVLSIDDFFDRAALLVRGVSQSGWKAKYVKEVDHDEMTTRFYQEIYDDAGNLVEIHEKYPVDRGHQKIRKE